MSNAAKCLIYNIYESNDKSSAVSKIKWKTLLIGTTKIKYIIMSTTVTHIYWVTSINII